MRRNFILASCALLLGLLSSRLPAQNPPPESATFPAVADTYLRQVQPNQNLGAEPFLRLQQTDKTRVLVGFDAAQIAAAVGGGTLRSATLVVTAEREGRNWGSAGRVVNVHRVTSPWTEAGATWNCPQDSNPQNDQPDCGPQWAGGAFVPAATASVLHIGDVVEHIEFDVTADVAALLAGTPHHGWLLRKTEEGSSGLVEYASREGAAERAPRLIVTFDPPAGGDQTPPSVVFAEPVVPILLDQPRPQVKIDYSDAGSGVDTASFRLRLEGDDITSTCVLAAASATCQLPPLTTATNGASQHRLDTEVRDQSGNAGTATLTLLLIQGQGDVEAPEVLIAAPAAGALLSSPAVTVNGMVMDDGVVQAVTANGVPATLDGTSFTGGVTLVEGENEILVRALDGAGKIGRTSVTVTLDTKPPILVIDVPESGLVTNDDSVTVRGTAVDRSGVARVTVDGVQTPLVDGAFEATLSLVAGARTIVVTAVDTAGHETSVTLPVSRFTVPRLAISSPADLSSTTASEITVEGSVTGTGATVAVNGVAAQVSGDTFVAVGVPLIAGPNLVTAVATDGAGHASTVTITVLRDIAEPRLAVYSPRDGAVVREDVIAVQGFVSDHGEGALDTPPPVVTVNGVPAAVANETFLASGVTLAPGDNTLTVVATDAAGNREQVTLAVRRETATGRRVEVVSGSLQSAVIGTQLPAPLVARVLDDSGQPVAGRAVLFTARGNDGSFPNGLRQAAVTTDGQGLATTPFTLGKRAGAGNQLVEASVAGFAGPAAFVSTALTGTPALIVADSGDQQVGAAGQPLPLTLAAAVTDSGFNRLAGVPVRFRVEAGGGSFVGGGQEVVVETDHLGRAVVSLRLGPGEGIGNNVVEATVVGSDPALVTGFAASGRVAGDPAATSISGVVLDNSNQPVPGATLRILGTTITTQTDEQGLFRIAPAPVGTVQLIVDGSTTTRPGTWPDLEYILTTVPGRDNTVNMPIFLLPLELGNSLVVDETRGGTVTLPDLPGFALEIQPGSVTFPGGSRSGLISVTVVHADKVPMIPNFGQQPRFIVTIQPANAIFDPPARLTLPNLDGLPPGAVTEMYSFDHDLGRFVSIGLATVSDDGTVVTSNPGAGVRKAGWHCGGNPSGSGTPHDCPTCQRCVNNRCAPDDGQSPPQRAPDDCKREICFAGTVRSQPDINEIPLDLVGNCADGICTGAGPDLRTNLSDAPAGQQCCDTGRGSGGTPFDPQQQCCEAPQLLNKYPMPSVDECPRRIARPGHVPGGGHTIGCGPEAADWTVPDNPNIKPSLLCFGPSFFSACGGHDRCYDSCNTPGKAACDSQFLADMLALCESASIQCRAGCIANAHLYYQAVNNFGGGPFESGQQHACQCCP